MIFVLRCTFGYPLMRPDLNIASRSFLASIIWSSALASLDSSSLSICSNTRGTPSALLLALRATAATMYHGLVEKAGAA